MPRFTHAFLYCLLLVQGVALAPNTLPGANPVPDGPGLELWAEVDEAVPSITLRFYRTNDYTIWRRDHGAEAWTLLVESTGPGTASWTDEAVEVGRAYEYAVRRPFGTSSIESRYGYAMAGIGLDRTGHRGTLVLVLAENIVAENTERLDRLYADLVGDGWKVETIYAPTFERSAFRARGSAGNGTLGFFGYRYPEIIRNRIREIHEASPGGVKQVYLLGHVPLVLTGTNIPHDDGHGNRAIYTSDHFYADMDGIWRDRLINSPDTALSDNAFGVPNIPGDGIWDPSAVPSPLEFGVGRVDPWDREGNDWFELSEPELVGRYLDKAHRYPMFRSYDENPEKVPI